jgi:prepilin-type N-terminal cleavage/methylation domain-containing protein
MNARTRRRAGGRTGMTLVELVVGLAITGLALAAGYAALGAAIDHRARANEATDALLRDAMVRQTLHRWLAAARVSAEENAPAFAGVDGEHQGLPDAELSFLTTAPTPVDAAVTRVRLYVDRDPATPERGLVAELSAWRGAVVGQPRRLVMEPRAAGLEVRYLSGVPGARQWLSSWISSSVMPAGLELRLVAAATDSLPAVLALPVHVSYTGAR